MNVNTQPLAIITVENTINEARAQIPAQFLSSTCYISYLKDAQKNGKQQTLLICSFVAVIRITGLKLLLW